MFPEHDSNLWIGLMVWNGITTASFWAFMGWYFTHRHFQVKDWVRTLREREMRNDAQAD